ncbi:MAG TPA: SDR family oxidoreductase [Candidatus Eisenbacteria bacterium]
MPTALVTGASSGIGWELARLLAEDGHDLVLVARSGEKLAEFGRELESSCHIGVRALVRDLADPDAAGSIANELARAGVVVDVLVNNAGLGVYGPFSETPAAREREMIQVNVAALTELTKRFLPSMLDRRRGRILNVASTAAFQPGPLMAVYYATKAYVLSFSEALANELEGSGVTVTALCPGPTVTNFQKDAGLERTRLFTSPLVTAPRTVAHAGIAGMKRGRRIVVPGIANKLLIQSVRFSPRRLVTAVARAIQENRRGT